MSLKNESLLTKEQTPLVYHFNTLAKNYFGSLSKELGPLDIERYYFVLALITDHKNISQQCLADCLDTDKANMVRIIHYLQKKGYVKRKINPDDRRQHMITPTPKAEKIVPVLNAAFTTINAGAFKGFSKTEIKLFYGMIERMFENLSGLPSDQFFLKYVKSKKS